MDHERVARVAKFAALPTMESARGQVFGLHVSLNRERSPSHQKISTNYCEKNLLLIYHLVLGQDADPIRIRNFQSGFGIFNPNLNSYLLEPQHWNNFIRHVSFLQITK